MLSKLRFTTLQSGLVLFWAIWLTLVTLTNMTDALRHLGVLASDITWASYNYALIVQTIGTHGASSFIAADVGGGAGVGTGTN